MSSSPANCTADSEGFPGIPHCLGLNCWNCVGVLEYSVVWDGICRNRLEGTGGQIQYNDDKHPEEVISRVWWSMVTE